MPISKQETIRNRPLSGDELSVYVRYVVKGVLQQRGVLDFDEVELVMNPLTVAMQNDFFFAGQFEHPGISFSIAGKFHKVEGKFAFTLKPVFKTTNPLYPEHKVFLRRTAGVLEPPIKPEDPNAEHQIDSFAISVAVDNPNLVRVHVGLPVNIESQLPPGPGELFGKTEQHEVLYDATDYPPLPAPGVVDTTELSAKDWGVPGGKWTGNIMTAACVGTGFINQVLEGQESDESYDASEVLQQIATQQTVATKVPEIPATQALPRPRDRRGWKK